MRDIAVVIPTVDRWPRAAYLGETLANFTRAGVWWSRRLHSMHIVDTGLVVPDVAPWPERALDGVTYSCAEHVDQPNIPLIHRPSARRLPTENAAAALRAGCLQGVAWVLFVEDDVDVCANFLCGIGEWLDRNARIDRHVYCFSGDNQAISDAVALGRETWNYPVASHWGTQCMALRQAAALDLSSWWVEHPLFRHADGREDTAYDLEMHRWADARGYQYFLASAPSFVSHIGVDSAINPTRAWHPQFTSWPGRDWSYQPKQQESRS